MGCKDANENRVLAASGSVINENLVSFQHEKMKNMDFIKKHKIYIIYAAQHTLKLVPCVWVRSINEIGKRKKGNLELLLLYHHKGNS